MFLVEEDAGIVGAMRAGGPFGVILAMAFRAALRDLEDITGLQANLFGHFATKMLHQLANVLEVKSCVEG